MVASSEQAASARVALNTSPASFRVYTSAELQTAPLRQPYRPPGHADAEETTPTSAKKAAFVAIGMALGGLLLGLAVLIGHVTDDYAPGTTTHDRADTRADTRDTKAAQASGPTIELGDNVTPAATTETPTDFELPDDSLQAPRVKKAKRGRARTATAVY